MRKKAQMPRSTFFSLISLRTLLRECRIPCWPYSVPRQLRSLHASTMEALGNMKGSEEATLTIAESIRHRLRSNDEMTRAQAVRAFVSQSMRLSDVGQKSRLLFSAIPMCADPCLDVRLALYAALDKRLGRLEKMVSQRTVDAGDTTNAALLWGPGEHASADTGEGAADLILENAEFDVAMQADQGPQKATCFWGDAPAEAGTKRGEEGGPFKFNEQDWANPIPVGESLSRRIGILCDLFCRPALNAEHAESHADDGRDENNQEASLETLEEMLHGKDIHGSGMDRETMENVLNDLLGSLTSDGGGSSESVQGAAVILALCHLGIMASKNDFAASILGKGDADDADDEEGESEIISIIVGHVLQLVSAGCFVTDTRSRFRVRCWPPASLRGKSSSSHPACD